MPERRDVMRKALTLVLVLASGAPAWAAGYAVREQSTDAMGSAYAGAAATATDASYLAYNPAAVSGTGGGDAALDIVAIVPSSSATYTTGVTAAGTPTGGSKTASGFIRNAVIPDIALRQRLSDRLSAGISVSVPWGLSTDYPSSYTGRYYGLETKLTTVNITPVLGYDLAPNISVAGGFQAQYAKGTLTSAVDIGTLGALAGIPGSVPGAMDGAAVVNAHSWAYGFVLGGRAAFDDGWTLGLSYRSEVHHTLKGPYTFTLDSTGLGAAIRAATGLLSNTTAQAKLVTPQVVEFGVRKQFGDRWTALFETDWTGWSAFNNLTITAANPVQPADITNANWKDAWMVAAGAEYAASDDWTLRAGTAYDESPIPDADRYWISVGATYHASASTDLKLTLSHLFNDTRNLSQLPTQTGNALRGALAGTTASGVDVAGFELAYRWQ
jgi:long-chain fatty acid transport protein